MQSLRPQQLLSLLLAFSAAGSAGWLFGRRPLPNQMRVCGSHPVRAWTTPVGLAASSWVLVVVGVLLVFWESPSLRLSGVSG